MSNSHRAVAIAVFVGLLHIIFAVGLYGAQAVIAIGMQYLCSFVKYSLIYDRLRLGVGCQRVVATDAHCQAAHILGNLVVDDLCVDLCCADMFVAEHL